MLELKNVELLTKLKNKPFTVRTRMLPVHCEMKNETSSKMYGERWQVTEKWTLKKVSCDILFNGKFIVLLEIFQLFVNFRILFVVYLHITRVHCV
jgi:hypothetical protein